MPKKPDFELQDAHKYFSAHCFNTTWSFIDKKERTAQDKEKMISLAFASIYHWLERDDCTDTNLSVGYWLASRVFALIGDPVPARKYGQMSLDYSSEDKPFYVGFAYEALARAEMVSGDNLKMSEYLAKAHEFANKVPDKETKKMLTDDLETIN